MGKRSKVFEDYLNAMKKGRDDILRKLRVAKSYMEVQELQHKLNIQNVKIKFAPIGYNIAMEEIKNQTKLP